MCSATSPPPGQPQVGVLLAGEAGVGQVLRGRRGPHGDRHLAAAAGHELLVGGAWSPRAAARGWAASRSPRGSGRRRRRPGRRRRRRGRRAGARMSSAMPASARKASYRAVVTAKPGGTGMPAAVIDTSEAHLPPSRSCSRGQAGVEELRCRWSCQASQVTGTATGTRKERFSRKSMPSGSARVRCGAFAATSSSDDARLELGEHVAQAVVDAEAEGQVLAGVGAVDVERLAVLEARLVAVGRAHEQQDVRPGRDGDAADRRRP